MKAKPKKKPRRVVLEHMTIGDGCCLCAAHRLIHGYKLGDSTTKIRLVAEVLK